MPAVGSTTNPFTGRTYKLKNISNFAVTIAANSSDKFRNISTTLSTFTLNPREFVELVNNGQAAGNATWDVSSINIATPPSKKWQFDDTYSIVATAPVTYTAPAQNSPVVIKDDIDLGLSLTVTIPPKSDGQIVINYSMQMGNNDGTVSSKGYIGILFLKGNVEADGGFKKSSNFW